MEVVVAAGGVVRVAAPVDQTFTQCAVMWPCIASHHVIQLQVLIVKLIE
jgi:hypothetical protein